MTLTLGGALLIAMLIVSVITMIGWPAQVKRVSWMGLWMTLFSLYLLFAHGILKS